jgi:hypothetical protein
MKPKARWGAVLAPVLVDLVVPLLIFYGFRQAGASVVEATLAGSVIPVTRMPDLDLGSGRTVMQLLRAGRSIVITPLDGSAARAVVQPDGYVCWASDDPQALVRTTSQR